jgi:hypothetical protein
LYKFDFLETTRKQLQEYSTHSTIQGLVYITDYRIGWFGRGFWILAVLLMITLGVYWNVVTYKNWKDKQVSYVWKLGKFVLKKIFSK